MQNVEDVKQGKGSNERKMGGGSEQIFRMLELVRHSCHKLMLTLLCSTTGGAAVGAAPHCQLKNSCKDFSNWFLRFNANSLN